MRIPLMPTVCILAGVGISNLAGWRRDRRYRAKLLLEARVAALDAAWQRTGLMDELVAEPNRTADSAFA
jgi:hypothetical protein